MDQSSQSEATEIQVRSAGSHRSLYCRFPVPRSTAHRRGRWCDAFGDREIAHDRRREVFLKAEGYQIVRVQNDDVYKHINDVLDMILMGLEGRL